MYQSLNQESLRRINNIVTNFKNYPAYAAYSISSYCYDFRSGVHALEISKNGRVINLWLFCPDTEGNIGSIAAYGSNMEGHLRAIRSTMTVFGLPVESAEIDRSGMSDYIDIYLK